MVVKIIALRLKVCRVNCQTYRYPPSIGFHLLHQKFKENINIDARMLGSLYKGGQQKIFSLLAQPCRQVVHRQDHRPCVVRASPFTKWIHSVHTRRNVPRVLSKFQIILLIELLPLASIGWMSKLSVALLALI